MPSDKTVYDTAIEIIPKIVLINTKADGFKERSNALIIGHSKSFAKAIIRLKMPVNIKTQSLITRLFLT